MWFSSGVHKQKVYYECLQLHPLAAAVELDLQVCSLSGAQLTSTPALHLAPILGYTAVKAAFLHKNTLWNVFRKSLKLEKRAETIRKISNNNNHTRFTGELLLVRIRYHMLHLRKLLTNRNISKIMFKRFSKTQYINWISYGSL